jgi:hypothetical protein
VQTLVGHCAGIVLKDCGIAVPSLDAERLEREMTLDELRALASEHKLEITPSPMLGEYLLQTIPQKRWSKEGKDWIGIGKLVLNPNHKFGRYTATGREAYLKYLTAGK